MLTTLLNTIPFTKFVLIQDTLDEKGIQLLNYLIKTHKQRNLKINYFVFEGVFNRIKSIHRDGVVLHDCVSETIAFDSFKKKISDAAIEGIVVIDSLSSVLIHYDFPAIYRMLYELCNNKENKQLIAMLHVDVLDETAKTTQSLEHLATCTLKLIPKTETHNRRISHTYKKIGGKIIKQVKKIEEFRFENENLLTEPVKKLDVQKLIQENINATLPENLTTFKISLDDKEKQSRDRLVLPYLPQKTDGAAIADTKIFYEFDSVDDWDEEDPDDDLDI